MYRTADLVLLESSLRVVDRCRLDQVSHRAGAYSRLIVGLILVGGGSIGATLVIERISAGLLVAATMSTGIVVTLAGLRLVALAWSDPAGDRAERLLDQLEELISTVPGRERYVAVDGQVLDSTGRALDLAEVVARLNGGPVIIREVG